MLLLTGQLGCVNVRNSIALLPQTLCVIVVLTDYEMVSIGLSQ